MSLLEAKVLLVKEAWDFVLRHSVELDKVDLEKVKHLGLAERMKN